MFNQSVGVKIDPAEKLDLRQGLKVLSSGRVFLCYCLLMEFLNTAT